MVREMKDSGIEWIGRIPGNWNIGRIDALYTLRIQKVSDRDYPPLSVTMKGVVPQLENAAKTNSHDDRKLVKKGDFAINSRSDRRGSCGISPLDGSVSLINTVLKPRYNMIPKYYDWLFHSTMFSDEFYKWGHGIVDDLWTTNWQDMKKISVPVPSLYEQQKIANFLDKKCSEIDSLTKNIEEQIKKLEENKKSVITETVTKGLNPDAKTKDSGIKWIGLVNDYYEIKKLKYVCKILDEFRQPVTAHLRSHDSEILYDYYGASGVIDKIDGFTINDDVLLIGEDGANLKMRNLPLIYQVHGKAWINNHAHILKPVHNVLDYTYAYFMLESLDINPYITGSAQPKFNQEQLKNMHVIVPPMQEQQKIAQYLSERCKILDAVIATKQSQLEFLADYKKSLIYEYVTGKKEVPHA